jgi:translation initiation factor 1 (eIF-1/SUI1)
MDKSGVPDIVAAARKAVVLVEGISDRIAVETLAARLGHDLAGGCPPSGN